MNTAAHKAQESHNGAWLPPQQESFPKTAPHDADVTRHCPILFSPGDMQGVCTQSVNDQSVALYTSHDSFTGLCRENPLVGWRHHIYVG